MSDRPSELFVKQILIGPMANYVYMVGDRTSRECYLVDPAWDIPALLKQVDDEGFKLKGVLVTHYHPDHIGGDFMGQHIPGVVEVLEDRPTKIFIHQAEAPYVAKTTGMDHTDFVSVDGNTEVTAGDIPIRFIHTPGHTPGSQCFLVGGNLVSGDTLFIGSCGRVDLPGSDPKDLYYSLTQKLAKLPDETVLLPGHDYAGGQQSTIGREKGSNPFMQFERLEDYLSMMGHA